MPDSNWLSGKFRDRCYILVFIRKYVNYADLRKEKRGLYPIVKFRILKI